MNAIIAARSMIPSGIPTPSPILVPVDRLVELVLEAVAFDSPPEGEYLFDVVVVNDAVLVVVVMISGGSEMSIGL